MALPALSGFLFKTRFGHVPRRKLVASSYRGEGRAQDSRCLYCSKQVHERRARAFRADSSYVYLQGVQTMFLSLGQSERCCNETGWSEQAGERAGGRAGKLAGWLPACKRMVISRGPTTRMPVNEGLGRWSGLSIMERDRTRGNGLGHDEYSSPVPNLRREDPSEEKTPEESAHEQQ